MLAPITGLFVAVLLISNISSTKMISLFGISFDGGTLLFPLSYIFADVLTEVYGYHKSRVVIWTGFISALLMSATFILVGLMPASPEWTMQASYNDILGFAPRIVLASLIAYVFGEFVNSYVLSRMKTRTNGEKQKSRFIISTIFGQAFDTVIFSCIAFIGVFSIELIISVILFNYVFKLLVETLLLPLTCRISNKLKLIENCDVYDDGINYHPFRGIF
jgi:hypothetical protein